MKGIGGGIITKKLLFAVLLISTLSLTSIASSSAADIGTVQKQSNNTIVVEEKSITKLNNTNCASQSAITQKPANQTTNLNSASNNKILENNQTTSTNIKSTVTSTNINSSNTSTTSQKTEASGAPVTKTAAAGSSSTNTNSEVITAATASKSKFETQYKFPATVQVGSNTMDAAPFIAMEAKAILQLNSGTNNPIPVNNWKWASSPLINGVNSGQIQKAEYLDIANKVYSYYKANGHAPNYVSTSKGQLNLVNLYYALDRILAFYQTNKYLPSYVTIKSPPSKVLAASGAVTPNPATDPYLQPTANCQVNDPAIKSLANSIAKNYVSTYDKATAIFNWVRDNLSYSFYYNTKYGAVGALNARTGNCVDTAHLVVALERAAGIPARYEHVKAQFSSGTWYGHVVAQVWINGIWYWADATSSYNTFGTIRNWNTASATYYGVYQSLPF